MANYINGLRLEDIARLALKEDIGRHDITTVSIIPRNKRIKAVLLVKEDCLVCGLNIVRLIFKAHDKHIRFKPLLKEGAWARKNKIIAEISGPARTILGAERVALNFLSLLCGTATKTRRFVTASRPYKARIIDTRKTIPLFRLLQKYAVRIGGGYNHRLSLDEMVLVKDNHLKVIGGYQRLRKLGLSGLGYQVELEVKNLKEFTHALGLKPELILLDNMNIKDMQKAVQTRNNLSGPRHKMPRLEASGGVTLKNVRKIAATGVDTISVGELTHSPDSIDISLEVL